MCLVHDAPLSSTPPLSYRNFASLRLPSHASGDAILFCPDLARVRQQIQQQPQEVDLSELNRHFDDDEMLQQVETLENGQVLEHAEDSVPCERFDYAKFEENLAQLGHGQIFKNEKEQQNWMKFKFEGVKQEHKPERRKQGS